MATKWVIRSVKILTKRDGSTAEYVSWWHGPDHGWGQTYGRVACRRWVKSRRAFVGPFTVDSSVATFPTRREAEVAYRSIYGRLFGGATAQRLSDAFAEDRAHTLAYEERKAAAS